MASIKKVPNSQYWQAIYRDATGRQRKKSTKEKNRKKAQKKADEFERASRATTANTETTDADDDRGGGLLYQVTKKTRPLVPYANTVALIEEFRERWTSLRAEKRKDVKSQFEQDIDRDAQGMDWAGLVDASINVEADNETARSERLLRGAPTILDELVVWIGEGDTAELRQFTDIFTAYEGGFKGWADKKVATLLVMIVCHKAREGWDKRHLPNRMIRKRANELWAEFGRPRRVNWGEIFKELGLVDISKGKPKTREGQENAELPVSQGEALQAQLAGAETKPDVKSP